MELSRPQIPSQSASYKDRTAPHPSKNQAVERYVAVWDFETTKIDEVELKKGDVVLVVKKYKDGWFRGVRCRDHQVGCFPGNFVIRDPSDEGNNEGPCVPIESPPNTPSSSTLSLSPPPDVATGLLIDISNELGFKFFDDEVCKPEDEKEDPPSTDNKLIQRYPPPTNSGSAKTFSSLQGLSILESGGPVEEESCERKRTKSAMEILTSELAFFTGLNILIQHFRNPLTERQIISSEQSKRIFANVESLQSISKEMIAKLQARLAYWDVNSSVIGDVLIEMFSYLKMFEPYFNSRPRANKMKTKLEKNNEKYRTFVCKAQTMCGQTLDSLMLMPIQRIPRYELLLSELVKKTSKEHPDYKNLKLALSKAKRAAEGLNEHIRTIDNETNLIRIIKSFPNDELNLFRPVVHSDPGRPPMGAVTVRNQPDNEQLSTISKNLKRMSLPLMESLPGVENSPKVLRSASLVPNTTAEYGDSTDSESDTETPRGETFLTSLYVHEGAVERVTKKGTGTVDGGIMYETVERYLFLFDNVFLIAVGSENRITSKKTYKLKDNIPLGQMWISDPNLYYTNPPEEMFLLGTPSQIYKFLAPSAYERDLWVKKVKTAIEKEKELFANYFRGLPVPDELFAAVAVEAKIDYNKGSEVELSLRQGEEVLVVGFTAPSCSWKPGLYTEYLFELSNDWCIDEFYLRWPGIYKGRFGWFPVQCVTGPDCSRLSFSEEQVRPIPVAVASNIIKKSMMQWTGSNYLPPDMSELKVLKVFKEDDTFKTCKVEPDFCVADVVRTYTQHKSFAGEKLDANILYLWEASHDGSVHRCLDDDEKLTSIMASWGKYTDKMKLVIRKGNPKTVELISIS